MNQSHHTKLSRLALWDRTSSCSSVPICHRTRVTNQHWQCRRSDFGTPALPDFPRGRKPPASGESTDHSAVCAGDRRSFLRGIVIPCVTVAKFFGSCKD
jgi:hypothetical protein